MQIPLSLQLIYPILLIYGFIAILRALMQYLDSDFHNPISQFIHRVTALPIKLLRVFVPRVRGSDSLSPLVLALLVAFAERFVWMQSNGIGLDIPATSVLTIAIVLERAINVMIIVILIRVVMSWVPIGTRSIQRLIFTTTEPLMSFARRFIPPFGALDFTPILILLALEVVSWIGVGSIEVMGYRLLNS
ncbi:MAG: YggT family protein [Acidiferrobacterales bacterium]|nr:YggT family protein [Acidiferrobacterales bacterium]